MPFDLRDRLCYGRSACRGKVPPFWAIRVDIMIRSGPSQCPQLTDIHDQIF